MTWAELLRRLFGEGVTGVALREAQGDYMEVIQRVRGALQAKYESQGKKDVWPDLYAVFADRAVVREDGVLLAYPFVFSADGSVTLGEPYRVEEKFDPAPGVTAPALPPNPSVAQAAPATPIVQAALIEAVAGDDPGRVFRIRVMRAGLSGNANYYPDTVLREAAPLFENVRVFVKSDADHLKGQGKDVRNLIGKITDVRFVEGQQPDTGELQATLHVLQSAGDVSARLTEAVSRQMTDIFGFSVDAEGRARVGAIGGKPAKISTRITRVKSVDLIVEPGAGGELIRLIEAQEDNTMWRDRLITMIRGKRPELLKGVDVAALSDDDLDAKFREAFADAGDNAASIDPAEIARQVDAQIEVRTYLREALADSRLPKAAQERLRKGFDGRASFTREEVDTAIKDERDYVARFVESGRVADLGGTARIEAGETQIGRAHV